MPFRDTRRRAEGSLRFLAFATTNVGTESAAGGTSCGGRHMASCERSECSVLSACSSGRVVRPTARMRWHGLNIRTIKNDSRNLGTKIGTKLSNTG